MALLLLTNPCIVPKECNEQDTPLMKVNKIEIHIECKY